jgi:hypothetical protein
MFSKSGGNLTFGSCGLTVIFTIVEIESAACSVSRQLILSAGDRRADAVLFRGCGFVAQATANATAARVTPLK